jgi:hypothetical protein
MDSMPYDFPCTSSPSVISPLTPKAYNVRVLVLGNGGAQISPVATGTVTVPSCGVADIGIVKFTVSPGGAAGSGGTAGSGAAGMSGSAGTGGKAGTSGGAGTTGAAGATGCGNIQTLFATHSCMVDMACHDSKGSAAGFSMVTAGWEKAMIGRLPRAGGANGLQSQCIGTTTPYLVAGSNPAKGLFLQKLTTPPCGARMPLVPPVFTDAEMACIQQWANNVVAGK